MCSYGTLGMFKEEPQEYALALRMGLVESQKENVTQALMRLMSKRKLSSVLFLFSRLCVFIHMPYVLFIYAHLSNFKCTTVFPSTFTAWFFCILPSAFGLLLFSFLRFSFCRFSAYGCLWSVSSAHFFKVFGDLPVVLTCCPCEIHLVTTSVRCCLIVI